MSQIDPIGSYHIYHIIGMLLLRNNIDIKLARPMQKILRVCPAIDNTYLMVTCQDVFDEEKLVHIDSKGKILWEKGYKDSIDTFGFLKDSEVIIMNVSKSLI